MRVNKTALFDVDGVLVSAGHFGRWLCDDKGLSQAQRQAFFSGGFKDCSRGKADLLEVLDGAMADWPFQETASALTDIWFRMDGQPLAAGHQLFDEVSKLGYTMGIATTQERYRKDYLLANIPAIASCTHHFVSCDLGCVKPEAAYFDAISERLGTRDILFFDDTPANVTAAKAAGWQAWHYTGQTCLADFGISP